MCLPFRCISQLGVDEQTDSAVDHGVVYRDAQKTFFFGKLFLIYSTEMRFSIYPRGYKSRYNASHFKFFCTVWLLGLILVGVDAVNEIKWGDLASTVGEEIVPHSTSPSTQEANKFLSELF